MTTPRGGAPRPRVRGARKKRPRVIAWVSEACTGCAGSPVCQPYCPVEECMVLVPDPAAPPFGVIRVDPTRCIGCRKCASQGPLGTYLDGCPWDAITLVDTGEYEARHGSISPERAGD